MGDTMRKLMSCGFWKCGSLLVLKVSNQSYWMSKSGQNWRKNDNFSVFFFNFFPTLTANSGLKPSKLKNYHIFGIPRTSAFSWYTPFRSYSGKHWEKYIFVCREMIKIFFKIPKIHQVLFRYLPELTAPNLSFTRSPRRDNPGEPIKSAPTFEEVL